MANGRRVNPVYRSISRPLTILGAERKLFFFAMCIGAGTFNLLGSLLGGVLMFLLACTHSDPQAALDHVTDVLAHGEGAAAAKEAEKGYSRYHNLSPEWAWKFTIVRASAAQRQGA